MRPRPLLDALYALLLIGVAATSAIAGRFEVSSDREAKDVVARIRAAHFLSHATFGPTMDEIEGLAQRIRRVGYKKALDQWIDRQFELPASTHVDLAIEMLHDNGYPNFENRPAMNLPVRYRYDAWWHRAIASEDQLRQRMAWALSQIFVVNDAARHNRSTIEPTGLPRYAGYSQYYDIFVHNAFGNYRDVLGEVTFHPIMGFFLTHLNNRKADPQRGIYPDENYARECMQLFTIGLHKFKDLAGTVATDSKGNPIETYDNEDIKTMARVFTGMTFNSSGFDGAQRYTMPMKMVNQMHDLEEKVLLDGTVLQRRTRGLNDVNAALDMLFNQFETAPFVSRLLIQRFTHSNPSEDYLKAVARAFVGSMGENRPYHTGPRGDLKAVVKTILLRNEASGLRIERIRDSNNKIIAVQATSRPNDRSHLHEPVLRYIAFIRAFEGESNAVKGRFHLGNTTASLNQSPFQSPTVFNFYSPDFQPAGPLSGTGMVAPEFEIFTSVAANRMFNRFRNDVVDENIDLGRINGVQRKVRLNFDPLFDIGRVTNPSRFSRSLPEVMEYLDLLLCQGTMSEETKQSIINAIRDNVSDRNSTRILQDVLRFSVLLVLTSPDCAIVD